MNEEQFRDKDDVYRNYAQGMAFAAFLLHGESGVYREKFLDLYVTRRHGLAAFAAQYGVSRQTLTRLAHLYGVELRAAARPRRAW